MEIAVGCDHAAVEMKNMVVALLKSDPELAKAVSVVSDCGAHSDASVDYPDFAKNVCDRVNTSSPTKEVRGILLCGSGIGMSIAANKFDGIRAALCHDHYTALMCREHNDANVLCAGARSSGPEIIKEMVKVYVLTPFSNTGNHPRRIAKIASFEGMGGRRPSNMDLMVAKYNPQNREEMLAASANYSDHYTALMTKSIDGATERMMNAAPFIGLTLSEDGDNGLIVESVYQSSPAYMVGIEPGDYMVSVGSKDEMSVTTLNEFRAAKDLLCVCGKLTTFTIRKNGATKVVQLWVMTTDKDHEGEPYFFSTEFASQLWLAEKGAAQ